MRLTFWNDRKGHYDWHCENNEIADKLAAYEDTELSPEEFRERTESVLELYGKLKPYADAEKQGRLVILPCKVGDKVWDKIADHIFTIQTVELGHKAGTLFRCGNPGTDDYAAFYDFEIGKRFDVLGHEEAEAALKGIKMKNKRWCIWQDEDTIGVYCTAHIHEDRVLNCPYKNLEERQRADYPCQDYRPMDGVRKDGT